jgi:hypothetical protein
MYHKELVLEIGLLKDDGDEVVGNINNEKTIMETITKLIVLLLGAKTLALLTCED